MTRNIPIIYYHSVAPAKNHAWFRNYLTLELKYFEEHLKYFVRNGYKHIFLRDLVINKEDPDLHQDDKMGVEIREKDSLDPDLHRDDKRASKKAVCLTFDDGYLDNFIYVYPLLKKYNAKATIFVNPVFADKRPLVRKTLEDYWNNKATLEDINHWGFLSWDEMRLMEKSGLVDIQSHTLTHTKYFVSDKLIGFHHPGADCLYYIGNLFPDRLPYYIEDKEFEKLIPYGYPIFEERSSIVARKVTIKQSFSHSVIQLLKDYDWKKPYNFAKIHGSIEHFYEESKRNNEIIDSVETEEEYKKRVHFELKESKEVIEKQLNKEVTICCWPHGDNNDFAHKTAIEIGYKTTMQGNQDYEIDKEDYTRIPPRIGLTKSKNSVLLTRLKINYKVKTAEKSFPYYTFNKLYNKLRYGIDIE